MWNEILVAVALVLVLEGIIPFLAPDKFRQALAQLIQMPDQVLRMVGLARYDPWHNFPIHSKTN